jgi:hypothetical protein
VLQVHAACFERCIGTEGKSEDALRADLSQWLNLSTKQADGDHGASAEQPALEGSAFDGSMRRKGLGFKGQSAFPNMQNKRLAMMALHTVRSLRTSGFGAAYRSLFSTQVEAGGEGVVRCRV